MTAGETSDIAATRTRRARGAALIIKALLAAFLLAGAGPALAQTPLDLELVLAADGSGSIDDDELALQREGYAAAITSADVLNAIRSGPHGAIAVTYFEWGAADSQVVIADWAVITDEASAGAFAQVLRDTPRGASGYNSISAAIDFGMRLMATNDYQGLRRVIDISADSSNLGGRPVEAARDDAVNDGFIINALAIKRPGGNPMRWGDDRPLEQYFADSVIGGPGAFVKTADETQSFADAVRQKLVLEIAFMAPGD